MKKHVVMLGVLAGLLLSWPVESQAQFYSPYIYNNNAYLNYAIASQRAKEVGKGSRASKRSHRSRRSRHARRSRRHAHKR